MSQGAAHQISPSSDENFSSESILLDRAKIFKSERSKLAMETQRQPAANSAPNFSMDDKRMAVELWKAKIPLKNIREQLNMSKATLKRVLDGRQPLPAVPGGVHAQEAAGGHQQGWQHHQVLGRGPVHPPALFRAKIASIRDIITFCVCFTSGGLTFERGHCT